MLFYHLHCKCFLFFRLLLVIPLILFSFLFVLFLIFDFLFFKFSILSRFFLFFSSWNSCCFLFLLSTYLYVVLFSFIIAVDCSYSSRNSWKYFYYVFVWWFLIIWKMHNWCFIPNLSIISRYIDAPFCLLMLLEAILIKRILKNDSTAFLSKSSFMK